MKSDAIAGGGIIGALVGGVSGAIIGSSPRKNLIEIIKEMKKEKELKNEKD